MRQDYGLYFDGQLSRGVPAGAPQILRDAALDVMNLVPPYWRSDARFFLVSSTMQMVVFPYLQVEGGKNSLRQSQLWQPLEADLTEIVSRAERIAQDRGRPYVSATSVVAALGQLAPQLQTTAFQIWGPNQGP